MPSTQSDGVQTKISEDLKGSLFVSVDTTGDAEVNVKSRILMKLQIAQKRAETEFAEIIKKKNLSDTGLHALREKTRLRTVTLLKSRYISTATRVLAALT